MKYIIEKKDERILSFLLDESGHAVLIHVDGLKDGLVPGDICIGLVTKVAHEIGAAFLELAGGIRGFLPLDEIVCPVYTSKGPSPDIQQGDELVVQICREAFGDKGMSLTTKLELSGRLLILTSGAQGLGVSHKIAKEKRQELKDRIMSSDEFMSLQERVGQCGVIVRTNAMAVSRKEILKELSDLEGQLLQIRLTAPYRQSHAILRKMPPKWLRRLDDLNITKTEEILTDSPDLFKAIRAHLSLPEGETARGEGVPAGSGIAVSMSEGGTARGEGVPARTGRFVSIPEGGTDSWSGNEKESSEAADIADRTGIRLRLYKDELVSMEKLYSLERELDRALSRIVNLRSGADLVIDKTEALYVIDVNSGRIKAGKKNKEELTLKVNLEAAYECARQIRLRNLSGIIIIDFINMVKDESYQKLQEALKEALLADSIHCQVMGFTKLGLMELTRKKVELSLADQIKL